MRQSLQLRLGQQLTMTPQLQQAIRLLQLSSLDLQTEIQSVLESNLMLESSGEDSSSELDTVAPQDELAEPTEGDDVLPSELPVDGSWEDSYSGYDGATVYSQPEQGDSYERQLVEGESLRDHLLWQMRLTPFSETDYTIATAIIDAVDDSGYLSLSLEDIRQGLEDEYDVDLAEVEAVLHRIQRFDPVGVAARDPAECLLLQLDALSAETPRLSEARNLLLRHLDLLANHDFNGLIRKLKVSREVLQEILSLIQSLNPRPGTLHSNNRTQYITPDVFVYRGNEGWRVELNTEHTPRLRINARYAQLVRRADSSADNLYLKNHLQEARWFLKSLRNRNETLLRVATAIVERQRDFMDAGEEHMKPLVLRDIAEILDMHESTISRVTTQKYMHTPRGTYELKYFFSSHVGASDGSEYSSTAIRAMIKKLIQEEDARRPLSDNKLAKLLDQAGIQVARRTVAKYREAMAIPSSTDRKRLG
jgi:RNA polymerase sigma-54 factor